MRTRILVSLAIAAVFIASAPPAFGSPAAVAVQSPSTCPAAVALVNGGFENPDISGVDIRDQSSVPGWSTTAGDGQIEMWDTNSGIAAGSGDQFVELNANQVSTLFQDVATIPGQLLRWQLQHRGREGVDVMAVALGAPGEPGEQQGDLISDSNDVWGTYSGLYTVPADQTTTRFSFVSVASTGGDSYGNFLDGISLGTAACVIVTKSVTNVTRPGSPAVSGDVLEYTITARNDGGVPADLAVVTDEVPTGTTYFAGSLTDASGSLTDVSGDDTAENTAGTLTWRIGDGADATTGGSIPSGESRAVTFQARVNTTTVELTLLNDAQVSFVETLTSTPATSTSNTTSNPVVASADLIATQTLLTPDVVAGDEARYDVGVVNAGSWTSLNTTLTATVPFAGMTTDDADCTIVGRQLTCDFGSLASGSSRTIELRGIVPAATRTAVLVSAVSGSVFDPNLPNNSATTTTTIPVAEISLSMTMINTDAAGPGEPAHPGDVLRARYRVTNSGNTAVDGVTVTDTTFGPVTCSPTSLAPGAGVTCLSDGTYTVTDADLLAGSVSRSSTAEATSSGPGAPVVTAADSATLAVTARVAALGVTGASPLNGFLLAALLLVGGAITLVSSRLARRPLVWE